MEIRLPLPALEPESERFWRAGRAGRLEITRCRACGWYIHPPPPRAARPVAPAIHPGADQHLERRAILSGVGQSQIGRRLLRTDLDLTCEAALAAIADAGLTTGDIDGLACYPGPMGTAAPGFAGPATPDVQDALGLQLGWHGSGGEGPAQLAPVMLAALAVAAGLCPHAR